VTTAGLFWYMHTCMYMYMYTYMFVFLWVLAEEYRRGGAGVEYYFQEFNEPC